MCISPKFVPEPEKIETDSYQRYPEQEVTGQNLKIIEYNTMKTRNITHFPYLVAKPQHMKPLEQVMCMVYLSQNYSLEDLRAKQDVVQQQIQSAHNYCLPTEDLLAIQDNLSAAVAYQSFPDDTVWMSFIKQT